MTWASSSGRQLSVISCKCWGPWYHRVEVRAGGKGGMRWYTKQYQLGQKHTGGRFWPLHASVAHHTLLPYTFLVPCHFVFQVLGALASVMMVWVITLNLLAEAIHRLIEPEPVNGKGEPAVFF